MSVQRNRFIRRIRSITGTQLSRDLKYYRRYMESKQQVALRGVGYHLVRNNKGGLTLEPVDMMDLLHAWCDGHGVDSCIED